MNKIIVIKQKRKPCKTDLFIDIMREYNIQRKEINKRIINFLLINKTKKYLSNELSKYICEFIYEEKIIMFR